MRKAKKYAIGAGIAVGFGAMAINAIKQWNEMSQNQDQQFDWGRLGKAGLKGAAAGTAGGFAVGAVRDYLNSLVKRENTDRYLEGLIGQLMLDKKSREYVALDRKANDLEQALMHKYSKKLHGPVSRLGSTERGTALQQSFDIDSGLNFNPNSFTSTSEMRQDVTEFLERLTDEGKVESYREQKNSIGVYFRGIESRVDIVPVKLTSGANGAGYLSVNKSSFFQNILSYKKTNIRALKGIKLTKTQKKIVILLKAWRNKYDIPLKSHLLEYLVIDAYEYSPSIPRTLTGKIVMVWRHIATNLEVAVIRGVENSNNVVTDIDSDDKRQIIDACESAVEDFEYQPNSIMKIIGSEK